MTISRADALMALYNAAEERDQINRIELGKRILAKRDEIIAENRRKAMCEISPETIAHVQKNRVAQPDPLPVTDAITAIHKSNADPVLAKNHYELLMKRVAAANNAEIAKSKGKTPHVEYADPSDDRDDDEESLDKKIARLMKERGWGADKFDLAASEAMKTSNPRTGPPNAQSRIATTRTETNINDTTAKQAPPAYIDTKWLRAGMEIDWNSPESATLAVRAEKAAKGMP